MSLMLLAVSSLLGGVAHASQTDTIGGTDTYNAQGQMLKLVQFTATDAAAMTEVRFGVYNYGSSGTPIIVLYHLNGSTYELVDQVNATNLPSSEFGWATAAGISWVVEPRQTYAIGAWMPDTWYYYYTNRSDNPWFGRVTGGFRYESSSPPATFQATSEGYYYYMEIDSEDADVDGDGVVGQTWGGLDCDDNNPAVGLATEEVPYDGIDQDCDGSDLTDVDGDGQAALEAGGVDCNDNDTSIASGGLEVCGDGVDQDCDGADLECGSVDDTGGGGGGGGGGNGDGTGNGGNALDLSAEGCGCASAPSGSLATLGGLLAGMMLLRRRAR